MIRFAFLDRDGTINVKAPEGDYIKSPDELELLPGSAEAIRRLNEAGVWVGVVTNQRGIALGRMTESDLDAVHAALRGELARHGARIDAIYHCPHDHDACDCRKPRPGLLLRAQADVPGLEFEQAVLVGDAESDVEAGHRAGVRALIRLSGDPREAREGEHVARSLPDAVDWLLSCACTAPT
jgi:D-glycero-D-manno-heptose 1,7-bisphosphate phosphatase